jgi:hypothetical protein
MEDGHDTRYYEGPHGRVPWMKRDKSQPDIVQDPESLSGLKQIYSVAKIALKGIWHDIKDRQS